MPTVDVAVVVEPLLPPNSPPRPRRPLVAALLVGVADPDCGPRSNMCTQPVAPCCVLTLVQGPLRSLLRVTVVWASSGATLAPVSAVWVLIVPLIDTVSCMLRRALSLRSPMSADGQHLHHLLQAWGLSPAQTVALMIALNGLGGAVGVAVWWYQVPEYWAFAAALGLKSTPTAPYTRVTTVSILSFRGRCSP